MKARTGYPYVKVGQLLDKDLIITYIADRGTGPSGGVRVKGFVSKSGTRFTTMYSHGSVGKFLLDFQDSLPLAIRVTYPEGGRYKAQLLKWDWSGGTRS